MIFQDQDVAIEAQARLEAAAHRYLPNLFSAGFDLSPDPNRSLTNLERWIQSTGNPSTYLELLESNTSLAKHLMVVLGASQHLADALIQNPEFGTLLFDPRELARTPTTKGLIKEGRSLLTAATSHSHALDRLRYLKQKWTLMIVLNDLSSAWEPEAVWQALTDLAEAILILAIELVWKEATGRAEPCPILVVAMGKMGGGELNYSSDIDLIYATPDAIDLSEKEKTRFTELLNRALTEPMGRGFLYRVDLRLRPYGSAGPTLPTIKAVENYYKLYAETWEYQALIRSKPIFGPEVIKERWDAIVLEHAFPAVLTEASIDAITAMRHRIEELSKEEDLKRGSGGIRDVEFLSQTLQMLHGRAKPALQTKSTLKALRALEEESLLEHSVALALENGYVFLRQLEHRVQLLANQQTHALPTDPQDQERISNLMGEPSWIALLRHLALHRRTIGTLYKTLVQHEVGAEGARARVGERLQALAPAAYAWFDPLPENEAFYDSLDQNEGSLSRVKTILECAPALIENFKRSVPLTEQLLSGEIEEPDTPEDRINNLPLDFGFRELAEIYTNSWTRLQARWALDPHKALQLELTRLADALLVHCCKRLYAAFDVLALGSYGRSELSAGSDLDLLLLVPDSKMHAEAERQAQELLSVFTALKRYGASVAVDLRLRPEGRQGLLVRTYEGLKVYDLERMEMWERFALGQARLVFGNAAARELALKIAYALPLTPERVKELATMKKRIEGERVKPQHQRRHLKLGLGGLGDIEWFVHLHEMRYPTATKAGENLRLEDGIRALGRAQLINAAEVAELLEGLHHQLDLRTRQNLMGFPNDVLPENPDKLDRLAHVCGYEEGNELLREHEKVIDRVRAIYQEGMERLRVDW